MMQQTVAVRSFTFVWFKALRAAPLAHLRDLSAVLLRKLLLLDEESMWEKMTLEGQVNLKARLLDALESETERSIRRNVCDTVSDLAIGTISPEQPWPELYLKLDQWVKGPNFELRESALYIFELMSQFFAVVSCLGFSLPPPSSPCWVRQRNDDGW